VFLDRSQPLATALTPVYTPDRGEGKQTPIFNSTTGGYLRDNRIEVIDEDAELGVPGVIGEVLDV
jgi:hypothetical protein